MKKYFLLGLVIMLMIFTNVSAQQNTNNELEKNTVDIEQKTADFTHTVFAEECTATWCPMCPTVAEALYNIYDGGEYPFYYVTLVDDMNPIAKQRNQDYSFGFVKVYALPQTYFDGAYTSMIGRLNTVPETENEYRTLIEEAGQKNPKQPITMSSEVTWNGNADLSVTITVTNDGNLPYIGRIRSYVTEIESRWNDYSGNPYHYAFLDYALNKFVILMPGKTKTLTGSFDGKADHGGQSYSDITSDNIMVISALSEWIPHYKVGYQSSEYTQRYFAKYVDQATSAVPS